LIDNQPIVEQTIADLIDWVERGIGPQGTSYGYHDGQVTLPPTATGRGGIQPVVSVAANGQTRCEAGPGEAVTLTVDAEVPPGAGTIVGVEWDFEGSGTYEYRHDGIDGTAARVHLETRHTFDRPGEYFVTARVHSHRRGDVHAQTRRIPNLAQARVIVAAGSLGPDAVEPSGGKS